MITQLPINGQMPVTQTSAATPTAPTPVHTPAPRAAADTMTFSNAEAMRILMRANQTGRDLAAKMKTLANKDEISSKVQGVKDQTAQVKGEQTSAMQGLASKMAGAGVSAYAGGKGTRMRASTDDNARAKGAALDSAAQGGALGNVVTSGSDMVDKLGGGAHEADMAKIALKMDDVQTSLATQRKDSANAILQQADKAIDSALDALKDFRGRAAEVISKLTGG